MVVFAHGMRFKQAHEGFHSFLEIDQRVKTIVGIAVLNSPPRDVQNPPIRTRLLMLIDDPLAQFRIHTARDADLDHPLFGG